jgi:hypothetical protein
MSPFEVTFGREPRTTQYPEVLFLEQNKAVKNVESEMIILK